VYFLSQAAALGTAAFTPVLAAAYLLGPPSPGSVGAALLAVPVPLLLGAWQASRSAVRGTP
jgi:hypothetical protein